MVNCELDVNFDTSKITKTSIHILINGLVFLWATEVPFTVCLIVKKA